MNLRLPVGIKAAVAAEGCQDVLVTQVLRPGLEGFRRLAKRLPQKGECVPEAVRVEISQAASREGILEDHSDSTGAAPVLQASPTASNLRHPVPPTLVAGKSGSSTTTAAISSPTGKNVVENDLENLVLTCRAS
jgi:hypothetical protein